MRKHRAILTIFHRTSLFRVKGQTPGTVKQNQLGIGIAALLLCANHNVIVPPFLIILPWRLEQFKELRNDVLFSRVNCEAYHA